ncbi:MAG: hypothetical protein LBG80_19950 [Bacteroidales bacterium]|nr:hypothetical protein [Bacteroidales bacterium]
MKHLFPILRFYCGS